LLLNHSTFIGVQYRYFYEQINSILDKMGLGVLPPLLNDLATIRIFEPASKLRSLELMEQFFGINHSRKSYYKIAPQCIKLKETVLQKIVAFATTVGVSVTNYGSPVLPYFKKYSKKR